MEEKKIKSFVHRCYNSAGISQTLKLLHDLDHTPGVYISDYGFKKESRNYEIFFSTDSAETITYLFLTYGCHLFEELNM